MVTADAPPQIFDAQLVARRRARAARACTDHFLRQRVVQDMGERLCAVNRDFPAVLELGGGGAFASFLAEAGSDVARDVAEKIGTVVTADVAQSCCPSADYGGRLVVREDALPFGEGIFDLIVSPLSLHTVNDLPGSLVQLRRALKPDGLMVMAMFGGDTLAELRVCLREAESAITGGAGFRVAPMADALDLSQLLQRAGFALPVSDTDKIPVRYGHPMRLLQDLRAMGETAAMTERARRPLRRDVLMEAMRRYGEHFADADGKCRASFEVIWATGWAPHDSQQKPLKPGSAKMRLADALGVREQSAGEKAGG